MRTKQKAGTRGSLMFVQQLVSRRPELLEYRLRETGAIPTDAEVRWVSPREEDEWAEYRDAAFLERVGLPQLGPALREFWPARGPQWDALGLTGQTVLLVEAKAHVGELASSCNAVAARSRDLITASLARTKTALGARAEADWLNGYYQLANRLAHLWFLNDRGVDARLVLLQFTGETGMPTDSTPGAYDRALRDGFRHLGFDPGRSIPGVVHVHVDVSELT